VGRDENHGVGVMRRSAVIENDQWVDVYTLPDGTRHVVYLAPYKLPTKYQMKLALKRAGIVLPTPPPSFEITDWQRSVAAVARLDAYVNGQPNDPRGTPEQYVQFGKKIILYWHRQYRIEGPELTARQKFEQHLFDNRYNDNDCGDA